MLVKRKKVFEKSVMKAKSKQYSESFFTENREGKNSFNFFFIWDMLFDSRESRKICRAVEHNIHFWSKKSKHMSRKSKHLSSTVKTYVEHSRNTQI